MVMMEEPAEEPVVVAAVVVAAVVVAVMVVAMPAAGPVTSVAIDGVVGESSPGGRDEKRPGKTGGAEHALEHCVPFWSVSPWHEGKAGVRWGWTPAQTTDACPVLFAVFVPPISARRQGRSWNQVKRP